MANKPKIKTLNNNNKNSLVEERNHASFLNHNLINNSISSLIKLIKICTVVHTLNQTKEKYLTDLMMIRIDMIIHVYINIQYILSTHIIFQFYFFNSYLQINSNCYTS